MEALAELARIDLSEEEKHKILKDMGGILEYVKQIEKIETNDVEVEYTLYNAWREDETGEDRDFSKDSIIAQFPDKHDNFLKVKKIL